MSFILGCGILKEGINQLPALRARPETRRGGMEERKGMSTIRRSSAKLVLEETGTEVLAKLVEDSGDPIPRVEQAGTK